MSWIRVDKLSKTRMITDLRKLSKESLYALIHLAFWEADHDCGKNDDAVKLFVKERDILTEYCYYDSI
jgi:hypothetical protein